MTINWMGSELSVRVPVVLHPGNRGGPPCVHRRRMVGDDSHEGWLVYAARGCDEVWYSGPYIDSEAIVEVVPQVVAAQDPVQPEPTDPAAA